MNARQPRPPITFRKVATLVRRSLQQGSSVKVEGLGVFSGDADGGIRFEPATRPRIFIAYVQEDRAAAEKLRAGFLAQGFDPWMDKHKLRAGQNWPRAVSRAIELADFFVPLFSPRSIVKRGRFQHELRYALECANNLPLDSTYLMPVRLEECSVPLALTRTVQYVDLFPDWDAGFRRLVEAVKHQGLSVLPG
jgi:hypothetical protein